MTSSQIPVNYLPVSQPRATLPSLETQSGAFADAAEFIHLDSHNRAVLMGLVLNQDGPGYIYAVPGDNVPEFVHIRPTVQRQERDWPTVCAIPYEHIFDLVKSQWSPQPGQEQDQIHQPQRLWRYQGAVDWLKSWEMPDGNWIKTSWRILKRESGISLWIYHFFISANTLMKLPKIRLFLCNQNAGFAVAPSTPEYPADNAFLM